DSSDGHPSAVQVNEKQNIVSYQASPGQHLDREEVRASEHIHMPANELLPGGRFAPLRHWLDPMAAAERCPRSDRTPGAPGWPTLPQFDRNPSRSFRAPTEQSDPRSLN